MTNSVVHAESSSTNAATTSSQGCLPIKLGLWPSSFLKVLACIHGGWVKALSGRSGELHHPGLC